MALSAAQIATLTALRDGRVDDVAIVTQIESELAEVARLMVPLSVAHSRTKLYWVEGEDASIFRSKDDGHRINGWYCTWVGTEPTFVEQTNRVVAAFAVQHLYEYAFGTNADNSQRQFNENCSRFLAAFDPINGIKSLAGKRFLTHSSTAGITDKVKPPLHFFNARLLFEVCTL